VCLILLVRRLREKAIVRVVNVLDLERGDIVPPLQELADATDSAVATRGRMLLELVTHLNDQGPNPDVCAMPLPGEQIMLYPPYPHPRSVWVEVELSEESSTARSRVGRYSWRVVDRSLGTVGSGLADMPADVEQAIRGAFGWL